MSTPALEDPQAMEAWRRLAERGVSRAFENLSGMVGREISASAVRLTRVDPRHVPQLFGGPEVVTLAVYLHVFGQARGHMVLVYHPQTACALVDMLMEMPIGTTAELQDMEMSALGEVGNVMGSSFLNVLADAAGVDLQPSPPDVVVDMVGALLDAILGDALQDSDTVLVLETGFGTAERHVSGTFLVLPSRELVELTLAQGLRR